MADKTLSATLAAQRKLEHTPDNPRGCWHPVGVHIGQALGVSIVDCRLRPHWIVTNGGRRYCTIHAKKLGLIEPLSHRPKKPGYVIYLD